MKKRILLILIILLVTVVGYFVQRRATADEIELLLDSSNPFAVRCALIDDTNRDQLAILLQAIVYPAHRRLALYFIRTDATYNDDEEPIYTMSPSQADRFEDYTGISSIYYIQIKRSDFARLIDLVEGLDFFTEQPHFFKEAKYQYPQGSHYYPGEQLLEYALSTRYDVGEGQLQKKRLRKKPTDSFDIDRLFRQESLLLNLLWQLQECKEKLSDGEMQDIALALPETNLNQSELLSLFQFLSSKNPVHYKALEMPLTKEDGKLLVKEEKARIFFQQFQDDLNTGRLIVAENITAEILNGTEVRGLAARLKRHLQNRGLQVLGVDNYEYQPLRHTILLERSGDTFPAAHIMELLSLPRSRIVFHRSVLDIGESLLIGSDLDPKKLRIR